jgi:glycogen operon protein
MRDLVSYNEKHNDANGEGNRDGESNNRGWNCGVEGPTDDAEINALRARQQRNLLTTLFVSQGVPMLLGGDEIGRTQQGNNNAYCQDNDLSWFDWENIDTELLQFTQDLIAFRKAHPSFRRRRFFQGRPIHGQDIADVEWYGADGGLMSDEDWDEGLAKALVMRLRGTAIDIDRRGEQVDDDSFLVVINAGTEPLAFVVPAQAVPARWEVVIDTETGSIGPTGREATAGEELELVSRSMMVLAGRT